MCVLKGQGNLGSVSIKLLLAMTGQMKMEDESCI